LTTKITDLNGNTFTVTGSARPGSVMLAVTSAHSGKVTAMEFSRAGAQALAFALMHHATEARR
jgi:hypothetical protein